jgi:hypothetical protein
MEIILHGIIRSSRTILEIPFEYFSYSGGALRQLSVIVAINFDLSCLRIDRHRGRDNDEHRGNLIYLHLRLLQKSEHKK